MDFNEQVDDFSEQIQEIITNVPSWIVRWGISLFFFVLFFFLILASLISMPNIIRGTLVIESEFAHEAVTVAVSGKLAKILINENTAVDSGQVLGYIESTANHDDILQLSENIDSIRNLLLYNEPNQLWSYTLWNFRHLGELQQSFQEFQQNLITFKSFLMEGLYEKKKKGILDEIKYIEAQNLQLNVQLKLEKENNALMLQDFKAYERLRQNKMVSDQEFRQVESKLISSRIPMQNTESSILANSSLLRQKQGDIVELNYQIDKAKMTFLSGVNSFKNEIDQWKRQFVLIAHSNGKVALSDRLYLGKWIEANRPILYIEPEKGSNYIGKLRLGQFSIGKIKKGQTVILKVAAYPYTEFGLLRGHIEYLSDAVYSDSLYIARVRLDYENRTTYNKEITLRNGLIADAEVITEKRNLLARLFDNVYSVMKNQP